MEWEGKSHIYSDNLDLEILQCVLASCDQQLPVSIGMLCTYAVNLVKSTLPVSYIQFNAFLVNIILTLWVFLAIARAVLWVFSKNKWAVLLVVLHCRYSDIGIIISNVGV